MSATLKNFRANVHFRIRHVDSVKTRRNVAFDTDEARRELQRLASDHRQGLGRFIFNFGGIEEIDLQDNEEVLALLQDIVWRAFQPKRRSKS